MVCVCVCEHVQCVYMHSSSESVVIPLCYGYHSRNHVYPYIVMHKGLL